MSKPITITKIRTILTSPEKIPLVIVKIETSEPGLYGLGCATFTQRYLAVATAIDEYLAPFLIGRDVAQIEDIWQTCMTSAYWRNGPITNNAVSGIDMALWDIKGKVAGMPVYDLLGGKTREAAAVYRHADGKSLTEVEDNVRKYMEQGLLYIRCQMGGYGGRIDQIKSPEGALPGAYFDPHGYARNTVKLFEHMRNTVGHDIELLHDVHERLAPIEAIRLSKNLEPYRLFFLEDALAPEQVDWFAIMRNQSSTPVAMGELFTHPQEWLPLIQNRLSISFVVTSAQLVELPQPRNWRTFVKHLASELHGMVQEMSLQLVTQLICISMLALQTLVFKSGGDLLTKFKRYSLELQFLRVAMSIQMTSQALESTSMRN